MASEILQTNTNALENQTIGDESIEKQLGHFTMNYNDSGYIGPQGTDFDSIRFFRRKIECSCLIVSMLLWTLLRQLLREVLENSYFIAQQERQENQYCCTRVLDSVEGFDILLS